MRCGLCGRLARALLGAFAGMLFASAAFAAEPSTESIWLLPVLGMPLGMMAAVMFTSALGSIKEPAQPDQDIPKRIAGIVFDGLAGGYLALLIVGFSLTRDYFTAVLPTVLGALLAMLMPWLRRHGKEYFDQLWRAVVSMVPSFRKRQPPDEPAGGAP